MRSWQLKVFFCILFTVCFFSITAAADMEKNKETAIEFVEGMLEKGNIDEIVDTYLSPDIETVFPPAFHMSLTGESYIKGKEDHRAAAKAWKKETAHRVEIVDVISEENKVVILAKVDRIFLIKEEMSFENQPFVFIFTFDGDMISKVEMIFDVLEAVERDKAEKYNF